MKVRDLRSVVNSLSSLVLLTTCIVSFSHAQQHASVVPTLVNFKGTLTDLNGKPLSGTVGVTFLLYKDEQGGSPLWMETQNVTPDKSGHYAVVLGTTTAQGLPTDLFASGEARWLGVQAQGQAEQPRVLLLSVPYALKAGDAQTVGGLPASAFVLAAPPGGGNATTTTATAAASNSASAPPPASSNVTTTGGTANTIPLFTTATNVQNSLLTQTGTTAINVGGKLNLSATGTATATVGKNSQPQDFVASVFNSGTKAAVAQTFQLQGEPLNNDKTTASGTLNLLYASGSATPAETGLKISSKGLIAFAAGQTFPGTGTVKSVGLSAPASDFTVSGSPVTTTGTLALTWNVAPTSADTANAIVKRDASGNFSAGTVAAANVSATDLTVSNTLNMTSSAKYPILVSDSSLSGSAVFGTSTSSGATAAGVFGATLSSQSNAYGVIGYAYADTGNPVGVYGFGTSQLSPGVFGQNGGESYTGSNLTPYWGSGVWGDGGLYKGNVGVTGTVDDGTAGAFYGNSPSGYATVFAWSGNSAAIPFEAYNSSVSYCDIDTHGNLNCSGTKNAVVPIDAGKRIVAMSAIESPKNWFEDFGSAQLVHGSAEIALDPDFIQTVNTTQEYHVFLTPYRDCKGLYVTNRTANSFEVHELGGGSASLSFGYRISALRKNYENIRFADHTHDQDGLKPMLERVRAARRKGAVSHLPTKNMAQMGPATQSSSAK